MDQKKYHCQIKLCGLHSGEDVEVANSLDIWAVGFVLTKSPREISPDLCRELCTQVRPEIKKIGVFVNEAPDTIKNICEFCGLDYAQGYGPYSAEDWDKFYAIPGIAAVRVKNEESLQDISKMRRKLFFLDAYVKGLPGGSGHAFDWSLAEKAKPFGDVILAGGLNLENISDAIAQVRPWGVDVSSGIELEKGVKDHNLMREFVSQVRNAEKIIF